MTNRCKLSSGKHIVIITAVVTVSQFQGFPGLSEAGLAPGRSCNYSQMAAGAGVISKDFSVLGLLVGVAVSGASSGTVAWRAYSLLLCVWHGRPHSKATGLQEREERETEREPGRSQLAIYDRLWETGSRPSAPSCLPVSSPSSRGRESDPTSQWAERQRFRGHVKPAHHSLRGFIKSASDPSASCPPTVFPCLRFCLRASVRAVPSARSTLPPGICLA